MAVPTRRARPTATARRPATAVVTRRPAEVKQPVRGAGAVEAEKTRLAKAAAATAEEPVVHERKAARPFTFKIGPVKPVGERLINILVYGPYGHGKTTFAGSAEDVPSMRDVLFINAESGDMSLTGRRGLDVININKYDQLARIFEYLTLHCKWRDEGNIEKLLEYERMLKSDPVPLSQQTEPAEEGRTWFVEQRLRLGKPLDEPFMYRTVILDSISELHKYLVYKFTGVDIGSTKLDDEVERMEEWQPAQELFRLLIRSFRDLKMNVIFVAAEDLRDPNRKKGERHGQYLPKLAGQMAGDVAGFIDIVGYLVREIGKDGATKRYLYLGAGYEEWISKHRFENLPDLEYLEDPTMTSLVELARKDAEYDGTRYTQGVASSSTVTARSSGTRTAATNRSRAASPAGSSSGGGARRGDHAVRRR